MKTVNAARTTLKKGPVGETIERPQEGRWLIMTRVKTLVDYNHFWKLAVSLFSGEAIENEKDSVAAFIDGAPNFCTDFLCTLRHKGWARGCCGNESNKAK